jgi:hypothetical protein
MNAQKALSQKAEHCPPPPDGDFYRIAEILDESEQLFSNGCAISWIEKSRRS